MSKLPIAARQERKEMLLITTSCLRNQNRRSKIIKWSVSNDITFLQTFCLYKCIKTKNTWVKERKTYIPIMLEFKPYLELKCPT